MDVTEKGSIGPLTSANVRSTYAVLLCQAAKDVHVDYWQVFLDDEVVTLASNADVGIDVKTLYFRVNQLERGTTYSAHVVATANGVGESFPSNTITFTTGE